MKKLFMIFTVIICFFNSSIFIHAQFDDQISASEPLVLPESINTLLHQIKIAEDNEDWEAYNLLRDQIINNLRNLDPDLSKLYNTVNTNTQFNISRDDDGNTNLDSNGNESEIDNRENTSSFIPDWGDDVVFYENRVLKDFSMDVSFDDEIYVSIATNNGGSVNDSLFIYKSDDDGLTWSLWATRFTTGDYDKTEIMCFDGSGEDYVLLFYTFTSGSINQRFNVARYLMSDPSSLSVNTISSGDIVDFAADRNWPASNYRAMVLYDSLSHIKSIRSEPSSYGTVWQDKYVIGQVGEDIDLCYGYLGSVYITYNGFSSGNLYVRENLNYCDPASWSTFEIIEPGATTTTMHSEVIASRENQPDINVQIIYTKLFGSTVDLRRANKDGAGSWTADIPFITNAGWDIKYPSLYCSKINLYTVFQNSYSMSQLVSPFARQVNQRVFDGSTWQGSQTISDYTPTGLQKSYVSELNGEPIVLYTGSNGRSLYFDNKAWVPPAPIINVDPTSLNFGGVTVNTSSMMIFTIENTGTADLIVTNITSSDPAFTVNLTNTTITPGNDQDVEVTFSPTLVQPYNGNIDITHNAAGSPSSVTVTGNGIVGIEDVTSGIPTEFSLFNNYPNPFNPGTIIYYGLPEASSVEITVYDILGNQIMKYVADHRAAGYHKINFDGSGLNSGIYFYQLQASDFVDTKKMILTK